MDIPYRQARRRRRLQPAEVLDDQGQEELIQQFQRDAAAQSRFYRAVFSVVLMVPSPAFILARHFRSHAKLALMCLLSLGTAVYNLRRADRPRAPVIRSLNMALGSLIALQAHRQLAPWQRVDVLWLLPAIAAFTVVVLEHWFKQVQAEIKRLSGVRYELRGA